MYAHLCICRHTHEGKHIQLPTRQRMHPKQHMHKYRCLHTQLHPYKGLMYTHTCAHTTISSQGPRVYTHTCARTTTSSQEPQVYIHTCAHTTTFSKGPHVFTHTCAHKASCVYYIHNTHILVHKHSWAQEHINTSHTSTPRCIGMHMQRTHTHRSYVYPHTWYTMTPSDL